MTTKISAFVAAMTAVAAQDVNLALAGVETALDNRIAFETAKGANESIRTKLAAARKKLATEPMIRAICVANVPTDFANRELTAGKRYNVYAVDKVADLLQLLATGAGKNAINLAVMRSLFNFRKAGVAFTGQTALAAVSDKVKVDKAIEQHLVRHSVSEATAPTQASSTMNALVTLGVVKNAGARNAPIWELVGSPATKRLEELLAA